MTLFRKLLITYLLVSILALVISGAFAGYMAGQAAGKSQIDQLAAYGRELAGRLENRHWTAEDLRLFQVTVDLLDRTRQARVWLVDREGLIQQNSSSASPSRGNRMRTEDMQEVLRGQTVVTSRRLPAGPPRPIVAVPIQRDGQVHGAVFISAPLDDVPEVRTSINRFLLYGSLLSTLVLAAISYYISQRVARPVAAVSSAARRLAQGDFGSRVQWRSNDEVGRLATAFNDMAADLERLERGRKELMANVSHELKGPLARIAGYVEAIRDGMGGPPAREQHFDIVRREVGRLAHLVNDLLDFTRLEGGRLKLHPIPCDLAPNLKRVAEVFTAPARAAGVTLAVQVPEVLPIVQCEPGRVEQSVTNLLDNALAFSLRGGVVTLTAREESGALLVEVQDNGPGIPPGDLERVWERFYKGDRARTPNQDGFGLGLAIVRQLIELQGGQVFVRSVPGAGACFGFRLPLATPE